jgi:hypothetical protein
MDDYLSKPFTQTQLRTILARWLTLSSGVTTEAIPPMIADSHLLGPPDQG